ncbi:MAG: NADH-quinone oxidoreductase subunit J [Acidobacteria bacterium]|nr:NADH-quinone oxidoreductase subunit J [Acidobacteriota bacterium]
MDPILFAIFAGIAVVCGIVMVTQRHPIASALSLIGVMGSLAVLYLLLGAEFIAAAQVIVYAGAIMVLFLFVIMLLNAGAEPKPLRSSYLAGFLGVPMVLALMGLLGYLVKRSFPLDVTVRFGDFTGGSAKAVGDALFRKYLLPFEVTSVLVLIAILGAVVLARKEMD